MNPFSELPDVVYKPPFGRAPPNRNSSFVVPYIAWSVLLSQLVDPNFMNGNVSQSSSSGISGPDIPVFLYRAEHITRALQTMSEYMTISMRASDSAENASLIASEQAISGTVWVQKQFVTVRWAWLALPIALLVLAILFLLASFVQTRRRGVGLWQSSPLALFFHSRLNDETQSRGWDSLSTEDAMQKAAADLCARIPKGARGTVEVCSKVASKKCRRIMK